MPSYPIIDQFAARLDEAGLLIGPVTHATRIEEFERMLERRLPRSFRHLVANNAFRPFEWGPVSFFGNSETYDAFSLHIAPMRDEVIWQTTRSGGFVYFGRPEVANYDPICFAATASDRESPIIQLDHEAILIERGIKVVREIAPSFAALAERLTSDGSDPIAIEEWSDEWLTDDRPADR
jgi:hypothetical protein